MSTLSPPTNPKDRVQSGINSRVMTGEAIRRRPMLLLAPAVVLAVLGGIIGLYVSPTYTATAQLVVRPLAPTVTQLSSAVQAAEDQATNESRLVTSSAVTQPLAREFHTTSTSIANDISATPIPSSTVIRLDAEASSAHKAVALANAAAKTFAHYANAELRSAAESEALLGRYEAAEILVSRAYITKAVLDAHHLSPDAPARLAAAATLAAANVRAKALVAQYESRIQAVATAPEVKSFSSAVSASSNRSSLLEIYVLGGLVVGLLVGAAAATMLANRPAASVASTDYS
jgi:capsular polysaccharide biosynthesis protein